MTIGEKIKELRKKNHITQEKLAQYLNISCQAVSKWESNIALPDITYVIPISNFFGISIDTLFDINPKTLSDEEPIITEKYQGLRESCKYAEAIEFMKSECNKYPRNYLFKSHLAEALRYNWSGNEEDTQLKECIELCERILNDCTDNDVRYPTMQQLFYAYRSAKNNEKAREIAEGLPNTPVCRDLLLEYVLSGEELEELLDTNLDHFMLYIWRKLQKTAKPKNERTIEDRIRAQKTAIQLYQLVYYDDKLGWYSNRVAENYKIWLKFTLN
jgi:transcriptional regulator with XRE-family HTH domain